MGTTTNVEITENLILTRIPTQLGLFEWHIRIKCNVEVSR